VASTAAAMSGAVSTSVPSRSKMIARTPARNGMASGGFGIVRRDAVERDRPDRRCAAGAAECLEARLADLARRDDRRLEELARIEFARVLRDRAADRTGHREADVGVDVDLADAVLDAFDDRFDRHAVRFLDVAAECSDHGEPFLRYRRGAVHDEVRRRNARMDRLDAFDVEDIAGR